MTTHQSVQRMTRDVRALPESAPADAADTDGDQLAREAAQAFADQLVRFRNDKAQYLDPTERPADWEIRHSRECPPENFTFADLERLSRDDPAGAADRWEEVKSAARRDLDSGWLAGRALEPQGGSAWDRACFLAVRDRLRRAWQPRNDAEAQLIDAMAQYEMIRRNWIRLLALWSRQPQTLLDMERRHERVKDERYTGPASSTLEAAKMLERLERLQQSAVRTLLNLRRTRATLTVRNTGPVNVALGPQPSVAGATADGAIAVRSGSVPCESDGC